jgi:hypothetical protein
MKLTKETQDFNSWVLGGAYSKNILKRSQNKRTDLESSKKTGDTPVVEDAFQRRLDKRKLQLKENKESAETNARPKPSYKLSPPRKTSSREQDDSAPPAARKLVRVSSPPRPDEGPTLRERLHQSFAQTTASHAYGTLFPPLLTPYSRPCNFLRFADTERKPVPEPDLSSKSQIAAPAFREPFSLAKNERNRPQPRSGPQAFFPTGSSATAYRFLAGSAYAARITGTAEGPSPRGRGTQSDELNGVLSSSKAPTNSLAP